MKESLSKAEWMVMETLWERSPMFLSDIMESMDGKVDWKKSTFSTYLKILTDEGYVGYETIRNCRSYYPLVARAQCAVNESRSLMARMTEDSARIFLSNMIKEGSLSKEDRDDLKRLIDEQEQAEREAPEGK